MSIFFRKEDEIDKELHISGFSKELENEEFDPDDLKCLDPDDVGCLNPDNLQCLDPDDVGCSEKLDDLQITEKSGASESNNETEDLSDQPVESICKKVESLKIPAEDRVDKLDNSHFSDSVSNFSYISHSTTSTIPPEIIHSRVKKALTKRSSAIDRKRCLAKGEASAVARKRKENKDVIKEYLNPSSVWG